MAITALIMAFSVVIAMFSAVKGYPAIMGENKDRYLKALPME